MEGNGPELSSALDKMDEILRLVGSRRIAVFLDYDGTLTPIVGRPEDAVLSEEMIRVVRELARNCTVAVVSGRDLRDVRERVGLEEIVYAGSHGFEIRGPDGMDLQIEKGLEYLPVLDRAEPMLVDRISPIAGARVERKRFSISVHYRHVAESRVGQVREAVNLTAQELSELRISAGKKVFELQPSIDWDKGEAVLWLLEALHMDPKHVVPFYLGDDTTDEDGFRAVKELGIGILVAEQPRETLARYRLRGPEEVREFLKTLALLLNPEE